MTLDTGRIVPPEMSDRFFRLQPVRREHLPFLYELATNPETGFRWRYRGSVPTAEQFEADFWKGALAQFLVVGRDSGEPLGLVVAYNANLHEGHAYGGVTFVPKLVGKGIALNAIWLFLRYVFATWNFRKIYFETPAFNAELFRSGAGTVFHEEGRFRDHAYYRGRYWDLVVYALYRPDGDDPPWSAHAGMVSNGSAARPAGTREG